MIEIEAVDRAAIDMRWRHREGDAADQAAPFRDRVMECEMREGFRDCIGGGFLRRGDCEQQADFVPEFSKAARATIKFPARASTSCPAFSSRTINAPPEMPMDP